MIASNFYFLPQAAILKQRQRKLLLPTSTIYKKPKKVGINKT